MKEIILKFLMKIIGPIFLSILAGGICGHIVYSIYVDNNDVVFSSKLVYVLQTGAYSDYNNMRVNSLSNDYVYYEDAGMFKTIIAMTQDEKNIDKIKKISGLDIVVGKYFISDSNLYDEIKSFDDNIRNEEDSDRINKLILSMLKKYHDKDNLQLVKIN